MQNSMVDSACVKTAEWLKAFNAALEHTTSDQLATLFCQDSHWRNIVGLTFTFGTVSDRDAVAQALYQASKECQAHDFEIDDQRLAPRQIERAGETVIEAMIRFKTSVGRGSGLLRLKGDCSDAAPLEAWSLLTTLQSIDGYDEESIRLGKETSPYEQDRHGPNWLDRRQEALRYAEREPTVLIVGGGHAGLSAAATLKALGVETLIVDRMARVGDNWRLRYHALKLHNMTPSNSLPYLSFPSTWPNYIPKDKIANWLEFYVDALELDFWTSTSFEGAIYDEALGTWKASLRLKDGTIREMRPAHIILATSVNGTPNIPEIPALKNFKGRVLHSSQFRNGAEWKNKNVLVFGTGTSAHDVMQDLHGSGAHATMVQRSPTEIVNIEPSAQLYDGVFYEKGPSSDDRDLISASVPLDILKKAHVLLTAKGRVFDAPLHERLRRVGFRLDTDETGWPLKYRLRGGGYYFNVGASDLIADEKVGLIQFQDIESFSAEGLSLKDGRHVPAELIVLATGYKGHDHTITNYFGEHVAKRVGPVWGFNAETQELRNMWMRTAQPGLWLTGGSFSQCRVFSKYLALQIKAVELGMFSK